MQNKTKRNIKKMIIASGAMVFVIISSVTANADTKSPARTDSDFVVVAEADGNVDQAAVDRANELLNRLPVQVLKNFQNRGWRFLVTDKNIARTYYSGQYSSVQGMDENVPHMHFTFVPIVQDKNKGHYKVCAKEALADCYGAKFQIELQDYVSAQMGKELNMVKKDTVDYERNVKELKKKTLNDRCAYLARQISKSEEELERKQRILKMAGITEKAEKEIDDIQTSTSNGYTVMRETDWLRVKPLLKSINAMKSERKELLKMLKEFKETSTVKENQSLKDEAAKLAKENERLERELQNVQRFMEQTRIDNRPIAEFYEESKKEQTAKHHDEWLASTYNDR